MAGSTLNSYFDYKGAANAPMPSNPYDYKPDPGIFGGAAPGGGSSYSPTPGGFRADEFLEDKNPYSYKPKSFLDKFVSALDQGANNAKYFKQQQQQEKEKEKSLFGNTANRGFGAQKLTENLTGIFQDPSPLAQMAGVPGEPGIGGQILSAASPLLSMIPGVGPALAVGAKMGSSFLG
jgi:hypothetical protein